MYVVIGANGYLGSYLTRIILENTHEKLLAVSRSVHDFNENDRLSYKTCDVTKHDDLISLYQKIKNENIKVLYLAALHHPDEIMRFPILAWNTNITALADFLGVFEHMKVFYYASTEMVYGETGVAPVGESAPLRPVNRYGELKALAEHMVTAAGFNVVRYSVLMGPSLIAGRKHFYDEIIDAAVEGRRMEMFCDQKRSMLDFRTAAELTIGLMESDEARKTSIVNISGDEFLSKYEMARRIINTKGLDDTFIVPVNMQDSSVFRAKRAANTLLDNRILKRILHLNNITMRFD